MAETELSGHAKKLMEGKNFAFLATVNSDGSPQLTPTWVDTDGEHVLINTSIGRVKQRNSKRDPRVAVVITNHENPYDVVIVKGNVVDQITGREADDHIDKLSRRYQGREKYVRQESGEQRVILKIKPIRVSG